MDLEQRGRVNGFRAPRDGRALARQCRVVHRDLMSLDQAAVRGYGFTGLQQHHITGNKVHHRDAVHLAVPQYATSVRRPGATLLGRERAASGSDRTVHVAAPPPGG